MAILVKFLTVVTRVETIKRKYPGGIDAYVKDNLIEKPYLDRYIVGALFMSTGEAEEFIGKLINLGFSYIKNNKFDEIAFIDMFVGPLFSSPWLGTKNCSHFNLKVKEATCWLKRNKKGNRKPLT